MSLFFASDFKHLGALVEDHAMHSSRSHSSLNYEKISPLHSSRITWLSDISGHRAFGTFHWREYEDEKGEVLTILLVIDLLEGGERSALYSASAIFSAVALRFPSGIKMILYVKAPEVQEGYMVAAQEEDEGLILWQRTNAMNARHLRAFFPQ